MLITLIEVLLLSSVTLAQAADEPPKRFLYLDDGEVRVGVDLESGGSLFHLSAGPERRNLLNHHDRGRFVQQSYYGKVDGSRWGEKEWCWNPVQGGDWRGHPGELLEKKATKTSLYTKSRPRHWSGCVDVPETLMEQWIGLEGPVAHVRYRFTYTGELDHPKRHQEMPAVFVDHALENLVFYRGADPWTGGELTRVVPGWPNEGHRRDECWAAYVDAEGEGVGVYTPGTPEMTCYRFEGPNGPKASGCSYFAPIRSLAITSGLKLEYDVYLTIGGVEEIRGRFAKIREKRLEGRAGGSGEEEEASRKKNGEDPGLAAA